MCSCVVVTVTPSRAHGLFYSTPPVAATELLGRLCHAPRPSDLNSTLLGNIYCFWTHIDLEPGSRERRWSSTRVASSSS